MTYRKPVSSPLPVRLVAAYEGPAVILVLGLCAITILSLTHPGLLALTRSVTLDASITAASLIIALCTAYFALGQYLLYGRLSSLYVGLAFLVFATGDSTLRLLPILAKWRQVTDWVDYAQGTYHLTGGALLVVAALLVDRETPLARRGRVLATWLVAVVFLGMLSTASVYTAPAGTVAGALETCFQIASGIFFFTASVLFWQAAKPQQETWFFWLAYSLGIAGFAQIQYAVHNYPIGVVQPGDVLRVVFFTGILLALAAQLSQDYLRLRWQARELGALHALMTPPSVADVNAVVHHIGQVVGDTLNARPRVLLEERLDQFAQDPLTAQMMSLDTYGHATAAPAGTPRILVGYDEGPHGHIALGVPLGTRERRLGMLTVLRDSGNDFSGHDVRLLRAFGVQASVLLERSLLYEEVAAGAILQERSRLAREIHDGLAQHLAFLKMRVGWLRRAPNRVGVSELSDIENVLESALIEARHAITTLRAEPEGTSTADAIEAYAEEFAQVSSLRVALEREPFVPEVGAKGRVELLRVVQEALNNVRKHANAREVHIRLRPSEGGILVAIEDDGTGFDIDTTPDGHFGLQIMRERMESIGGTLDIRSQPHVGTEVEVWVPVREAEEEREALTSGLA